jgi:hypothetical protein
VWALQIVLPCVRKPTGLELLRARSSPDEQTSARSLGEEASAALTCAWTG